jgi:hypothetical protein
MKYSPFNFIIMFEHKFNYGDCVINHKGNGGVITAMRFYQSIHFRPDAYTVEYSIDPSPGLESDDEFWESEVNLKIIIMVVNKNGDRFNSTGTCFAKLSTWSCKGVSCGWYKEKEK